MKVIFTIILFFNFCFTFSQTKVEKSKQELTKNSASTNTSSTSRTTSSRSSNTNNDTNLFVEIAGYVFLGVFKYGVIGDYKNENHLYTNLTDYPYYNGESGNYENYNSIDADSTKKNFRFDIENHFLYSDKALFGNHLKAKIRPFQYFYLQADYHQLFEKDNRTHSTEKLSLYYFNLGYDRIRFESFNFGFTLGISYVGNDVKKAGFSAGINTEAFIGHNISLAAAAKWSTINGQSVNAYELQSRYHSKRYFVTLGFEHLKIASPQYNFITLGGGIYLN